MIKVSDLRAVAFLRRFDEVNYCIALALMFSLQAHVCGKAPTFAWRVGTATTDITPFEPVLLSGYGGRNKPHESVKHRLFAKALAFEDEVGHRAVIMTADLVSIGGETADAICRQVMESTGLKRQQILLNVSHTHAGPEVWMEEVRGTSPVHDATRRNILAMQKSLSNVMIKALENLQPARIYLGLGIADFVVSRREFTRNGIVLGVNPRGYADRGVPVLRVESNDGKILAVMFGTACHPTTSGPKNFAIDPDFPGYAQDSVEAAIPGVLALYMAGCGGDANPFPRGSLEQAAEHGAALGREVLRVARSELTELRGPLRTVYRNVSLPMQPVPAIDELQKLAHETSGQSWKPWAANKMLSMIRADQKIPQSYEAPIAVWQVGTDLTLVALPLEPVSDYVQLLEQHVPPKQLWVAGYCNEVFGYLPSKRILAEGGYESRGIDTGPGVGQFSPEVQDVVLNAVEQLRDELSQARN